MNLGTGGVGSAAGRAPHTAAQRPPSQLGYAWDPHILGDREPQTSGYGLSRRSVRGRARTVRAARSQQGSWVREPIVLVVAGGAVGALGWIGMTQAALNVIGREFKVAPGEPQLFLIAVAAYLSGIALFSWAWELGDRAKAFKLGATIAVLGVAVWLIVAGIAVILALASKGAGGDGGRANGGGSGSHPGAPGTVGQGGEVAVSATQAPDTWERIAYGATKATLDRLDAARYGAAPEEPPVHRDEVAPPPDWRGRRSRRKSVE